MTASFRSLAAAVIALMALVVAAVGCGLALRSQHHAEALAASLDQARTRGHANASTLAQSEVELCVRIYSQLTLIEQLQTRQQTLTFYRHILPDIPLRTVRRLLANARRQTRLMLAELSPRHCSLLPSQPLTSP